MAEQVGHVAEVWRYPVKSMIGERLEQVPLTIEGVLGDRGWAARDEVRGGIRGAKKIGTLMKLRARYLDEPTPESPTPHVEITLPDGDTVTTDDADVDARVSKALDHEVTLHALRPPTDLDHYRRGAPDHDDVLDELRSIFGRESDEPLPDLAGFPPELVGQLMEFESPPGSHFDAFPVLLLTDTTLRTLSELAPGSAFDVRRFRPNAFVALDDGATGFPEQSWLGRRVQVGDAVFRVDAACPRCVMVTRGLDDLPEDRAVLRTIVREASQNVGVYATVERPGTLAAGAGVTLLD